MNQEFIVTGEQFVGKGIRMAADYVDTSMGKGTEKVIARPSTYINLIAVVGGLLLYAYGKPNAQGIQKLSTATNQAALVIGSNILAEKIPDYAVEMLSPASLTKTSYGRVTSATIRPTVTITPSRTASVPAASGFF